MRLSTVFQAAITDIDLQSDECTTTDLATAVRITKDYLEKGLLPAAIIVRGHPTNGRLILHSGLVAYSVACALGIRYVGVQELLSDSRAAQRAG